MSTPSCPFPGLLPFQEKDAPFFFGRDRETAELLRCLERNRFVAVIGVSGSGKSSLVHAGLKPELHLESPPWCIVEMKPGSGPRRGLQSALESMAAGAEWSELLGKSSYGLVDGVGKAGLKAGGKVLVIVDQFEEIFSYRKRGRSEAEEADLFVQQLLRASAEPGVPVYVMLTMRTDYLGHCALFRSLAEALNEGTYLVPRLTRHEQDEAIRSPLAVSGVEIEPEAVDLLLNAAEANRDELPVLQHLLKRLWEEWRERGAAGKIGREDYERTGGWDEAIARDGNSVLDALAGPEQEAVKLAFQRITEKGTGERPIRMPCSLTELSELTRSLVTAERLREVLAAFRKRDLLVWAEEQKGQERIDIPHECVTWRWKKLAEWIEEEDRDMRRLAFIAESARAETPLAGSALEEARALRGRIVGPWVWRYKLDAGELTRWIDHSEREATRARQRTRKLVIGLGLATLLFAALGLWAWQQKKLADESRRIAEAERLKAAAAETKADAASQESYVERLKAEAALASAKGEAKKAAELEAEATSQRTKWATTKASAEQQEAESAKTQAALTHEQRSVLDQIENLRIQLSTANREISRLRKELSLLQLVRLQRINVALAANGATAVASSISKVASYPASSVINGDRKGLNWEKGGGWNDGTVDAYPDWIQIDFNGSNTINEIDIFTIQDDYKYPIEPNEDMSFKLFGIMDFEVQYWNSTAWSAIPQGIVTNNDKVWRKFVVADITTDKIRVVINRSRGNYSRIVEIEAYVGPVGKQTGPSAARM